MVQLDCQQTPIDNALSLYEAVIKIINFSLTTQIAHETLERTYITKVI